MSLKSFSYMLLQSMKKPLYNAGLNLLGDTVRQRVVRPMFHRPQESGSSRCISKASLIVGGFLVKTLIEKYRKSENTEIEEDPSNVPDSLIHPRELTIQDDEDASHFSPKEIDSAVRDLKGALQKHESNKSEAVVTKVTNCDSWHLEWAASDVTIWSRPVENKKSREYKVHGRFMDIPATAFFHAQISTADRKRWDDSTDEICKINSGVREDVVYWRVKFPRPMAKRDYVFARRYGTDLKRNCLVIINKAIEDPDYPADKKYVRVTDYESKMIIQPHSTFNQNGFDYLVIYHEDCQVKAPQQAITKAVVNGVPKSLANVGEQCRKLAALPALSQTSKKPEKRPIRFKKIRPPEFLPDRRKWLDQIFQQGRFWPIPMRRVHRYEDKED